MSQPNSKYVAGGMRIITTADGKQYPAFPDGIPFASTKSTIISQDSEQARYGIAKIWAEIYVCIPEGAFQSEEYCLFNNGHLSFNGREILIGHPWSLTMQSKMDDTDYPFILTFIATAYPDTTTAP